MTMIEKKKKYAIVSQEVFENSLYATFISYVQVNHTILYIYVACCWNVFMKFNISMRYVCDKCRTEISNI